MEVLVSIIVFVVILALGYWFLAWLVGLIGLGGLFVLGSLGVVGWGGYYWYNNRVELRINPNVDYKAKRKIGHDGELVLTDTKSGTWNFSFRGKGTQVMEESVYLSAGTYRLKYQFPRPGSEKKYHGKDWNYVDVPSVNVVAIEVSQNEPISILAASNKGSQTFLMEADGCYVFQVRCHEDRDNEKWKIACTKL